MRQISTCLFCLICDISIILNCITLLEAPWVLLKILPSLKPRGVKSASFGIGRFGNTKCLAVKIISNSPSSHSIQDEDMGLSCIYFSSIPARLDRRGSARLKTSGWKLHPCAAPLRVPKDLVHVYSLTPPKKTRKSEPNWTSSNIHKKIEKKHIIWRFNLAFFGEFNMSFFFLQAHCNATWCWEVITWIQRVVGIPQVVGKHFRSGGAPSFFLNRNRAPRKKTLKSLDLGHLFPNDKSDKWSVHPGCLFFKGDERLATYI